MNAGRLRHRVMIERATITHTPGGQETVWAEDRAVWAAVVQVTASGAARYEQAGYSHVTHEVVMRAGPDLPLGKTRLRWGSDILEPVAPTQDTENRGRFQTIACREITDTIN